MSNHVPGFFGVLTVVALAACASCKSTLPKSVGTLVDESRREAAPTPAPAPKEIPQMFQWIIVKPSTTPFAEGEFAWDVEAKTGGEIWCERMCSKFKLDEKEDGDTLSLAAIKTPVPGNTNPGMLDTRKDLRGSRGKIAKVRFQNVGKMGEAVTVEDFIDKDHPNLYAVPVMISKSTVGPTPYIRGELVGKVMEVRIDPKDMPEGLVLNAEPVSAFLIGSVISGKAPDGAETQVFVARKVIAPWSGD